MKYLRKIIEYAFYLYIFLIPWQARIIFAQGQLNGKPWEYGTISIYLSEALLAFIAIAALLVHLKDYDEENHYKGRKALNVFMLALLFFGGAAVSTFFALDRSLAIRALIHLGEGLAIFLIVNEIKFSVHNLGRVLVASAVVQSLLAITQFFYQEVWSSTILGISHKLPQMLGISVVETAGGRFLRAYGTFGHPNVLAAFLVIGLIMALSLLLTHRSRLEKIIVSISAIVISAGLFYTFSRAAYLVLFLTVAIIAIYLWMNKTDGLNKIFIQFIVLLAAPMAVLALLNTNLVFNHYLSPSIIDSASVTDRSSLLQEARTLVEKNWLKGVGIGNYTLAAYNLNPTRAGESYQPVHDVFLLSLVETGLIGTLLFLLFLQEILKIIIGFKVTYNLEILEELKQYGKMYQTDYGLTTHWYVCLTALVVGMLVWFFFDHFFWTLYPGIIMFWLILGLWAKMLIRLKT